MNGYINPTIFVPVILAGIDREILNLQTLLMDTMVIEKIFGQGFVQVDRVADTERRAPFGYLKNNEPINLMPNDNIISQSFFIASDPEEILDEGSLVESLISVTDVSLIVWGNIKLIPGHSVETVKIAVLQSLKKYPNLQVKRVYKSFDEVFSRFTITEKMNSYNRLPFFGIRIDFKLNFVLTPENC